MMVDTEHLVGLVDVATRLGRTRQTVSNWVSRQARDVPQPLFSLSGNPVWDWRDWQVWATRNADLTRPASAA